MSCWLEHTPLRIRMTLGILGKQFRYAYSFPILLICIMFLMLFLHHSYPDFLFYSTAYNGCSIQNP